MKRNRENERFTWNGQGVDGFVARCFHKQSHPVRLVAVTFRFTTTHLWNAGARDPSKASPKSLRFCPRFPSCCLKLRKIRMHRPEDFVWRKQWRAHDVITALRNKKWQELRKRSDYRAESPATNPTGLTYIAGVEHYSFLVHYAYKHETSVFHFLTDIEDDYFSIYERFSDWVCDKKTHNFAVKCHQKTSFFGMIVPLILY